MPIDLLMAVETRTAVNPDSAGGLGTVIDLRRGRSGGADAPCSVEVTFLIPCLNEAESLGHVLGEIHTAYRESSLDYEILVADNGSTDGSREIAHELGARIVDERRSGYGAALLAGIDAARGEYVVMGDADGSYAFGDAAAMLAPLRTGADVVIGNRFAGGIEPGAMPPLHKYVGNPVLSALGRRFFGLKVRDFHCGLRAFRRDRIVELQLRTLGMEFASEMLVKAEKAGYDIEEVPVRLLPDLRSRRPHLRTFRDGWRHLRFLFLNAPGWTFLPPAVIAGSLSVLLAVAGPLNIGSIQLSYRTSIAASALASIATAAAWARYLARAILGEDQGRVPAEALALFSSFVALAGVGLLVSQLISWQSANFGDQAVGQGTLIATLGGFLLVVGGVSFVFSLLIGLVRNNLR